MYRLRLTCLFWKHVVELDYNNFYKAYWNLIAMNSNPYFRIVRDSNSGKYLAEVHRDVANSDDQPNITPFGIENIISIGDPKEVNLFEQSGLCDGLRELYPVVEKNGKVANAFTDLNFEGSRFVQFYNIPSK
jgi:hypothetical protein